MELKLVAQWSLPSYKRCTPRPTSSGLATPFLASSASNPSPSIIRRQSLIPKELVKPADQFVEATKATVAKCTAICCCYPCGLFNLIMVVMVKFLMGLVDGQCTGGGSATPS